MIHILKNTKGEFYWLSVVPKGTSFEENAKPSESFTQKHNCEKSMMQEAKVFGSNGIFEVIDHTTKHPTYYQFYAEDLNQSFKKRGAENNLEEFSNKQMKEIQFVAALKKKRNGTKRN